MGKLTRKQKFHVVVHSLIAFATMGVFGDYAYDAREHQDDEDEVRAAATAATNSPTCGV